jgi:hypothetical protein
MPISPITLQRRFAELGRIRLGAKQGGNGRPMKLAAFRFNSANKRYIDDLAVLYGGEARPWDNGGKPEFEVFTDATSIPVVAMKGGLSQWMETWSGGGCTHRCDGEVDAMTNERCDPDDRLHQEAKPTTRLSLMLPELDAIGAWRMESHGWNAAAEIPAVAELAQFVGDLVPAHLNMIERRSVKDGKTSRFVVPVLDLQIGAARLREIVAEKSGTVALEAGGGGERPALPAGSLAPAGPVEDAFTPFFARLAEASTFDEVQDVWSAAAAEHLVGLESEATERRGEFFNAVKARGEQLKAAGQEPTNTEPAEQANEDGTYDAVIVEDPPTEPAVDSGAAEDVIWQQILAAGGNKGWELDQVTDDFKAQMGGLLPDDASAQELQHYLGLLTGERAA